MFNKMSDKTTDSKSVFEFLEDLYEPSKKTHKSLTTVMNLEKITKKINNHKSKKRNLI
jgi:hypothetical protein